METKALVLQTWDDVVFQNRNKAYGAYALRKAYHDRILLGLGVSVLLAIVLTTLPRFLKTEIKTKDLGRIITCTLGPVLSDPPVIEKNVQVAPKAMKQEKVRANTIPIVTKQKVDDAPVTTEPVMASIEGTDTGVATDLPVAGTGSDVAVVSVEKVGPDFVVGAEVMPQYQGGMEELMKFIKKKMRYPATPKRMGIDGTVFVSFIVNGDGSIRDVSVIRGVHEDLDKEAMRVISMLPGWKGGKQGGYPVAVKMVLPIKFALEK